MNSFKFLIVFLFTTFGLVNLSNAQINCDEPVFYQRVDPPAGSDINFHYMVVKFDYANNRLMRIYSSIYQIKEALEASPNFYDNWHPRYGNLNNGCYYLDNQGLRNSRGSLIYEHVINIFEYDYQMSTSTREVYKGKHDDHNFMKPNNTDYYCIAFSKDLSSLIIWEDRNGNIKKKKYFVRVSKEEFLPKAANYDFLDE